ncbi:MAG TPA: hypothetical protein VE967_11300 [Gemmatimonadaceae bacterium]|nr:hypothetical protein [Gemmatimonadaceae bacterium]
MPRLRSVLATVALALIAGVSQAQTVSKLRATEEMRIDGAAESLVGFYTLVVGRDGRIAIPQNSDGTIAFYDDRGHKLGTFGRKGAGPGEFNILTGDMGWVGDTLWVFDFNNGRRVTYISPDRKLVRAPSIATGTPYDPTPTASGVKHVSLAAAHIERVYPDGTMLAPWSFGAAYDDQRYIVVTRSGDIVREVAKLPRSNGRVDVRTNGQHASADIPFFGAPQHSVSGDGTRIAMLSTTTMAGANGSYNVTVVRSTADTVFSKTYAFQGVRIPQAAKDSVLNRMIERGKVNTPEGRFPGEELAKLAKEKMPEYYAPVKDIVAGDDDTTWLVMRETGPGERVRALDARGNVIGDVTLKARSMLARATRTTLWVIEFDADGTPSVARYRVGGPINDR